MCRRWSLRLRRERRRSRRREGQGGEVAGRGGRPPRRCARHLLPKRFAERLVALLCIEVSDVHHHHHAPTR